jgi:hypothetical protein
LDTSDVNKDKIKEHVKSESLFASSEKLRVVSLLFKNLGKGFSFSLLEYILRNKEFDEHRLQAVLGELCSKGIIIKEIGSEGVMYQLQYSLKIKIE